MTSQKTRKKPVFIFDIGGVLIDWNPRYLFRDLFAGDEERMEYFLAEICPQAWNVKQDLGRTVAEATEERIALFPEYEPFIRAYYGRYNETISGEIRGTVEVLEALRASGYTLAGLSNWSAETFALMRERFEFLSWFEALVVSGDVGLIKPDPAIYQLVMERVGCEAGDCLFIDDNQTNVEAAKALGMQTILFASPEQLSQELRRRKLIT